MNTHAKGHRLAQESMVCMNDLKSHLQNKNAQRKSDRKSFEKLDDNLCMICWAYGQDKRNLVIRCFYDVKEVVPEMLDLKEHFYARICKSCRASFLGKLREWRDKRVALRDISKDHDGNFYDFDFERNIPVRINGAITMMTEEEHEEYHRTK